VTITQSGAIRSGPGRGRGDRYGAFPTRYAVAPASGTDPQMLLDQPPFRGAGSRLLRTISSNSGDSGSSVPVRCAAAKAFGDVEPDVLRLRHRSSQSDVRGSAFCARIVSRAKFYSRRSGDSGMYVYPALVDTGLLCECHSFVGDGALVAESALAALGVVEGLDVIEEGGP
jgi:hypothetical protein